MIIDAINSFWNLITGFNSIVAYNVKYGISPSRELFVAEDYINNKIDKSDACNPDLNAQYLKYLQRTDYKSYQFINNLLNNPVYE